ncbi:putative glycosyltransferase [Geitlerinema sp. FC II]|nr:putative glycosyltransferase [Geitlerinema sp. FC II]
MTREYYDRINHQLLDALPIDVGRIIEIGCGTGALGHAYKQKHPNTEYIGIELEAEVAEIAQTRLDRAIAANVENLDDPQLQFSPESVDCLVYGDVLEHLVDPWRVLNHHVKWLKPGGWVVSSIPNIQNWTILRDLIRGQWEYQDEGLLDRTHLRFFTLETAQTMFAEAGLQVRQVGRTISHDPREFEAIYPHLEMVAKTLNQPLDRFKLLVETHQFVIAATKPQRRLLIQTLMMAPLACDRVRVLEPDEFSNRIPGVRAVSSVKNAALNIAEPSEEKVFVWQRALLEPKIAIKQQKNLLDRGYLIVAEIDDDPMRWPQFEQTDFFSYRSCHCVQTSTEPLAEFLRQFNPYVKVFPNHLATLPPPRSPADYDAATVFFGALNREGDWKPLIGSINRVLSEFGDRVTVKVLHDRSFFDALATPNKAFAPFCPYETYQQVLRSSTVALLPLEPTRFNQMKSDLKFVECGGQGLAVLASPTVYERSIIDGETGLIYRSTDDFEAKFRELLANANLRRKLGTNAYHWVAAHRLLERHPSDRAAWYLEMRDRLPELNAALRQRVPQLFE